MLQAARDGNLKEIKKYFKHKKPAFLITDNHNWTALHYAAKGSHYKIVKFLLKRKVIDQEAETYEGETALYFAIQYKASLDVVKALLAGGGDVVSINNNEMFSPLMKACTVRLDYVMLLANAGADINHTDFNGDTALSVAVQSNKAGIVEYLLHLGADAEIRDDFGLTALACAAYKSYSECVKVLIDFTPDVNATGHDGCTALMLAAQTGNDVILDILIDNGADVNMIANDDTSVLHYALYSNSIRNTNKILALMSDHDVTSILNNTSKLCSPLFLALTMLRPITNETMSMVNRLVEQISAKALQEYDNKHELITYLVDKYFVFIVDQSPEHMEYVLQVLLMKGMGFSGLSEFVTNVSHACIRKCAPLSVLHIFNMLIKYGFNITTQSFKFSMFSDEYSFQANKCYELELVHNRQSKDREFNRIDVVRDLKKLSQIAIKNEISNNVASTQRFRLAVGQLCVPQCLKDYLLET